MPKAQVRPRLESQATAVSSSPTACGELLKYLKQQRDLVLLAVRNCAWPQCEWLGSCRTPGEKQQVPSRNSWVPGRSGAMTYCSRAVRELD